MNCVVLSIFGEYFVVTLFYSNECYLPNNHLTFFSVVYKEKYQALQKANTPD